MLYTLYIGSNNVTKELELSKIKDIVGKEFDGFTIIEATGYWKGSEEKTAIVEIVSDNKETIAMLVYLLKTNLNQEAIMVRQSSDIISFE